MENKSIYIRLDIESKEDISDEIINEIISECISSFEYNQNSMRINCTEIHWSEKI